MLSIFTPEGTEPDAGAVEQIERVMEDERVRGAALMADHHLGYSMPIGGVAAYEGAVSPSGVGYDIACGNLAIETDVVVTEDLDERTLYLAIDAIAQKVAFGMGRNNPEPVDHGLFDDPVWPELHQLLPGIKDLARNQLGTVGSGNHYVDLLVAEEDGRLWVANHFGSRGLGHKIATCFLNLAAGRMPAERVNDAHDAPPTVLAVGTNAGDLYLEAMRLAGEYAYAGREFVADQVLGILGAEREWEVHNHHNFAWEEDGLWVVRKGATPLGLEAAFIGGSMGDDSVIVRGARGPTGDVEDIGAIGSAPHGAGRVMSRTKAAGKWKKVPVERTAPDGTKYTKRVRVRDAATGAVDWPKTWRELHDRGIVVRGGGADEAPQVYKSLRDVIDAHSNIDVVRVLRPIGVVMAGEDVRDEYKD